MKIFRIILSLLIHLLPCNACDDIPQTSEIKLDLNHPLVSTLNPSCSYKQVTVYIPFKGNYRIVIVQLHTQYQIVSLSYKNHYIYDESYNSSNPGILNLLDQTERRLHVYIGSNSTTPAPSSLFAVGYAEKSPIPGGCCLTCDLEIDPNIKITYHNGMTYLFFHRASQYIFPSYKEPICDGTSPSTYKLRYEIYYLYVNDFSKKSYFDSIWKMSMPKQIKKYGTSLSEISGRSLLKLVLQPVKGQGIVFNVIVHDLESETTSAYVPISTYNCKFDGPNADCYVKTDTTSIVYCSLCTVIGFALCFAGLKLLPLLLFIVGLLFYWLFIYVAIYRCLIDNLNRKDDNLHDVMVMSSLCAICGGAMTLFFYAFQKLLFFSFLTLSLFTGMFVTSIIFYSPIGHLSFWVGDEKFMLAFSCISICLATFFFFAPKFLSIFSSCAIGSYALILVPNYLFNGTLQYVILVAVLRLSSSPDFFLESPYLSSDYILSGLWVLLFVIGVVIQHFSTRDKKMEMVVLYFNRSSGIQRSEPRHVHQRHNSEINRSLLSDSIDQLHVPNERTPLFHNEPDNSAFLFNTECSQSPTISTNPSYPSAPPHPSSSPPPPYSLLPSE